MIAYVHRTPEGFIVEADSQGVESYDFKQVITHSRGVELWAEAMKHAATWDPDEIILKGFPDLDQAIRDYVAAGGEM